MKAILYAAGRATRLGAEYAERPKIMVEVGGRTLLDRHISRLAEAGLREVVIVTGHRAEVIHDDLPRLSRTYGIPVRARFNPDHGEGSVISMLTSFPDLDDCPNGVLLMDGDVLYDSQMLPRLIGSPHRSALLVDFNYSTADDDPVLVPIRGGRPVEFRKKWTGTADRVGESVGFFKVAPADLPLLREETLSRRVGLSRLDSMDEVLRAMVIAGRFGYEDITGLPWTEIDFPSDVEYARATVLPALQETGSKSSPALPRR